MYKIIGADKKEYGPVSGEQLREWIQQGRVSAQTLAQAEGQADWRPVIAFPEFAEAFAAKSPAAPPTAPSVMMTDVSMHDYDLDIGACIGRSWELLRKNFWPVVGVSLLVLIVVGVMQQLLGLLTHSTWQEMIRDHHFSAGGVAIILLTSLISTPLYAVLMAGLFKYYLKLVRGEAAGLGDAFSGFGVSFLQLSLLGLASGFLTLIGYGLCLLPGIYLAIAWVFAAPLVIDRQMNFWPAMELSRKLVSKHWFMVFALVIVTTLLIIVGVLACCVGILVTIPLGLIALAYAYEDIFRPQTA